MQTLQKPDMSATQDPGNINDTYFDGYYKEIWRAVIPDELTGKEIDFMIQYFDLKPGDSVLDIMCGYGRHSIGLSEKGMVVTAVDNLEVYIDEINQSAKNKALPITVVLADVAKYESNDFFNLAICMGNSLNFFNYEDAQNIISNISSSLKPGGHFFINSWSIAEIAIRSFKEKGGSEINGLKFSAECKFLFHPSRIETVSTIVAPDGTTETKTAIDYIFSITEMETMLNNAGLVLKEIYSIPGKKKFALGDPRAYIIAEKIA